MVMDGNQIYYCDHFIVYTNIESTQETYIKIYVNYTLFLKNVVHPHLIPGETDSSKTESKCHFSKSPPNLKAKSWD